MAQSTSLLLLAGPAVIGGIVAAVNSDSVNAATERAELWGRESQAKLGTHGGYTRYGINPVLWLIVRFSDWTDGFEHRGIKNGARIAAALYLVVAWLFLLVTLVQIVVVLAITLFILFVAFKVLVNSNDSVRRGYEMGRRVIGSAGPGNRVNQETGRIQEEGLLGWRDTDRRIDPETGRLQEEALLGWRDTDARVDQESGIVQEEGLLGFRDTETRINPETGIIQRMGLVGWQDTDERIDPATGRRQRQGLLGWVDE